jgi:hypothetical protein
MEDRVIANLLDQIDALKHENHDEIPLRRPMSKPLQVPPHDIDMYGLAAPITALNLATGWTAATTAKLRAAVAAVAEANPLLTGRIAKTGEDIVVIPSLLGIDDIFKTAVGPSDYTVPVTLSDQLGSMQEMLEPLFKPFNLNNDLASGSPLFRVTVLTLAAGTVCFTVQLSHILGDGATYYRMCDQINSVVNGKELSECIWKAAEGDVALPSHFSEDDVFCLQKSWVPAFVERLKNEPPRSSNLCVFDGAAIASLKAPLLASAGPDSGAKFLSANDIIVSGLSEMLKEKNEITFMYANMRGRMSNTPTELCGNYERPIYYPTALAATKPEYVRGKMIPNFNIMERNEMVEKYKEGFNSAHFAAITSWASLTSLVTPPGTQFVAHCPDSSFVAGIAFDVAIIFKADAKGTLVMNHNFYTDAESGYEARLKASTIMKKIIS